MIKVCESLLSVFFSVPCVKPYLLISCPQRREEILAHSPVEQTLSEMFCDDSLLQGLPLHFS